MNSRVRIQLLAASIVPLLSIIACTGVTPTQAIQNPIDTPRQNTPTVTAAIITLTPSPTQNPKPTSTLSLEVLYQDDFSNPASGWESYRSTDGMLDYDDGK
jgi:hypothetical protein